jgi:K+ transporter
MDRRVVLLTVSIADTPTASFENRVEVRALPHGFYRVIARYTSSGAPSAFATSNPTGTPPRGRASTTTS